MDLIKQKKDMPGPGAYEVHISQFASIEGIEPIAEEETKKIKKGYRMKKDESERCIFAVGEVYSPGPAQYQESAHKMDKDEWVRKKSHASFDRADRDI